MSRILTVLAGLVFFASPAVADRIIVKDTGGKFVTGTGTFNCIAGCPGGSRWKVASGSCRIVSGNAQIVGFGIPSAEEAAPFDPAYSWLCRYNAPAGEAEVFCEAHCMSHSNR